MAEQPRNALSGFFRRPKVLAQETAASDVAICSSTEDLSEGEEHAPLQSLPVGRASSYMGFRATTPPVPLVAQAFTKVRHPESVYYKPSGDQLAETLKVVMMNQDPMISLPIAYNGCVLHVLEAYQQLREEVSVKLVAIEEMKHQHLKDIRELDVLQANWNSKEANMRADIKRLEVLLSETDGGLEKIIVARSRSSIHKARETRERVGCDVARVQTRNVASTSVARGCAINTKDVEDTIIEGRMGNPLSTTTAGTTTSITGKARKVFCHKGQINQPQTPTTSFPSLPAHDISGNSVGFLGHRPSKSECPRTTSSDAIAVREREQFNKEQDTLRQGIAETDLNVQLPTRQKKEGKNHSMDEQELKVHSKGVSAFNTFGFSFQPGDDVHLFSRDAAASKNDLRGKLHGQVRGYVTGQPRSSHELVGGGETCEVQAEAVRLTSAQSHESGSVCDVQNPSQSERQGCNKHEGKDALIAAAAAFNKQQRKDER